MRAMPSFTSSTSPICSAPMAWSYRSISPSSTFLISLARSWVSAAISSIPFPGPAAAGVEHSIYLRNSVLSAQSPVPSPQFAGTLGTGHWALFSHRRRNAGVHQAPAQALRPRADRAVQNLVAHAHHHPAQQVGVDREGGDHRLPQALGEGGGDLLLQPG